MVLAWSATALPRQTPTPIQATVAPRGLAVTGPSAAAVRASTGISLQKAQYVRPGRRFRSSRGRICGETRRRGVRIARIGRRDGRKEASMSPTAIMMTVVAHPLQVLLMGVVLSSG